MVRARSCSRSPRQPVLAVLIGLVFLGATLAGCGGSEEITPDSAEYAASASYPGVPLSDELRDTVVTGRRSINQPQPDRPPPTNTVTTDLDRYNDLASRIYRPDERQTVGDELYALWRVQPLHFFWIDLANNFEFLLHRGVERDSLYSLPALTDTSDARACFALARRTRSRAERARYLQQAEQKLGSLAPFEQVWVTRRIARAGSGAGQHLDAVGRLLDWLPAARDAGGLRLEMLLWNDIARYLARADRLDDALHAASLAEAQAAACGSSHRALQFRRRVAYILAARGENDAALELVEETARTATKLNHPGVFTLCTNQAAAICAKQGDHRRALRHNLASLAANLAADDSVNAPINMYNVSYNYRLLGQLDSCLVYQEMAAQWVAACSYQRNKAVLPLKLAEYYFQQGNYATVDSLLQAAVVRLERDGTANDEAELLKNMIRQGLEAGQPQLAYRALSRLQELRGAFHDTASDYSLLADIEIDTANFLARQGEHVLAAEALDRARETVESRAAEYDEWILRQCACELALLNEDITTARQAAERCLGIAKKRNDPELLIISRYLLGRVHLEEGDFEAARRLFQERETDTSYGGNFRTRLSSLIHLGVSYAREDRYEEAADHFQRAAHLFSRQPPRDLEARLNIERAHARIAAGDADAAARFLMRALELLRLPRRTGDDEILAALEAFDSSAYREAVETLIGLYHDHPSLIAEGDPAAHALLLAEECRWHASPLPALPDQAPHLLDLDGRLVKHVSPLLAYFVGKERSFGWLVAGVGAGAGAGARTGSSRMVMWQLPGREALRRLLIPVLADMEQAGAPVEPRAVELLSQTLLGDLARHWRKEETLHIVADDLLFAVPWLALVLPADTASDEHELILDRGPVVEAPSLASLVSLVPRPPSQAFAPTTSARLLALGIDGDPREGTAATSLPALRHAEAEARQVAALWPEEAAVLKVGEAASWTNIAAGELSRYRVIHLATHAVVHQGLPGRSTLRLAAVDGSDPLTIPAIAELELNADLIYLSCCEAARRVAGSGGLVSFARAFLRAGARTVIAPTIRVDDEATRYVADSFYRHWLAGKSKAASLRAALREIRSADSDWRHPYYWAFYRLIGDGG